MKNRPLCSLCLFFCLLICIGTVLGGGKLIKELSPSAAELYLKEDEEILAAGRVYQKADKEKYQLLYLKDNSINSHQQSLKESRLIIYDEEKCGVSIGDTLVVQGTVRFFENARNPGNFDSKRYYQRQDIHARVWAKSIEKRRGSPSTIYEKMKNALHEFRQEWKDGLCRAMGEKDGNMLCAMLLGEKGQMDEELKELYQTNGIGHVLAISGLHLSFIGIGIYKILRRVTGSYPIGGIFGILFLMLYILMVGFTVSAVRALVMFLFRVGADMAGRHYDAPTALSAAAVAVLLWRPLSLYDGGFWLSFGAVFAILTVVPVLQGWMERIFPENEGNKKGKSGRIYGGYRICVSIVQGLTASIAINLLLLPIMLYYFFEFPIYSLILNLFVIPLMSVLLFMGMAGSLFSVFFLPLSDVCFWICGGILRLYEMGCNLALTLPGARFVAGKPEIWQIAVYYGILVIVLLLLREKERLREYVDDVDDVGGAESKKYRTCGRGNSSRKHAGSGSGRSMQKYVVRESEVSMQKYTVRESDVSVQKRVTRIGRFALMLGMAGMIILTHRWGERGKLTAVILDVGQGDGIFMRGPEGGTYLVDGGSSDVKKVGQYRIEPFLKSQGVGVIDYVLISHGDSDHMNGVEELLERQGIGVKIKTLVLPVQEVWDEAFILLAKTAERYGTKVVVIKAGQNIQEGEMLVTCIQPGDIETESASAKSETKAESASSALEPGNEASMVLAVKYGEFDMLLTGDVEKEGEDQLTKRLEGQYQDCTWEVLKTAHHGSKNSSSEEFLRQVKPAYAFISAGRANRYGHPHRETVERLADVGSKIYSTQENGAIIIEVRSGETVKIKKY